MHVIRNISQGVPGVSVLGGDMSDERLAQLRHVAEPLARRNGVTFRTYHAQRDPPPGPFHYIALMVPAPALVAQAVQQVAPRGLINIFAGIPAHVTHPVDLDTYVARQAYFIGTSGSTLDDMRIVLKKVTDRALDTNLSVAAISGLEGAIDGIRAVEKQLIAGKILVYPSCRGLPLTPPRAPLAGDRHAWHLYPVRLADGAGVPRDRFIERLFEAGIGSSVHYIPLHLHPYWRERYGLRPEQFPHSQHAYERMASLPIYTRMSDADVERVVGAVRAALG